MFSGEAGAGRVREVERTRPWTGQGSRSGREGDAQKKSTTEFTAAEVCLTNHVVRWTPTELLITL